VAIGRATLAGFRTGQIETALAGSPAGGFDGALAAHDDQGAGEGEVGGERVDGEGMDAAAFDPAVGTGVFEKRGVSGKASNALAGASSFGWLP